MKLAPLLLLASCHAGEFGGTVSVVVALVTGGLFALAVFSRGPVGTATTLRECEDGTLVDDDGEPWA